MEAETQDLDRMEQKIFQRYNSDGAFETLIGLGLLGGGLILSHVFQATFGGILPVILLLLGRAWKKRITYPRLGYVEMNALRQKHKRLQKLFVFSVLAVLIVFTVILLIRQDAGAGDPWHKYAWIVFMSMVAVIVVAVSLFRARQAPVLYVFAALVAVFVILVFTHLMNPATMLLISGGAFAVYGLIKLVRFLQNNPPLPRDADHDILR